jgi:glycosyltransferase involved in cell wall biosynthesis
MIQISGNVIVENEWCESYCKAIAPNCKTFKSKLSIKQEFYGYEWKADNMKPYTIMSNSVTSQIKGVHMLLKAMSIVIKKYPETKLLITGEKTRFENNPFKIWRINGYTKYLKSLIEEHDLKNSICFLGELSSSQMAEQMANSNVFVMSSSIENHSSILMEAMIVGIPCISSFVGGIPEYLHHNVNGLLYRFEDYEILAFNIIKIFDDIIFASKIALNGRITMRNSRNANNIKEEFLGIYNNVLNS